MEKVEKNEENERKGHAFLLSSLGHSVTRLILKSPLHAAVLRLFKR